MNSLQQRSTAIELTSLPDGFALTYHQRLILRHSTETPCLWVGAGVADIDMFRGNFSIKDRLNEKIALTGATVSESPDGWRVHFSRGDTINATLHISTDEQGRLKLDLHNGDLNHNRIWLRLAAGRTITIYGCGEQFSYFDLRGKPFPLWTSEQGVGRNKNSYVTGKPTVKRTPVATTTGPSSHSRPSSARRSTTATLITVAI